MRARGDAAGRDPPGTTSSQYRRPAAGRPRHRHLGRCGGDPAGPFDAPILRAFRSEGDGSLAYAWPEHAMTRSQDLPEFLHDAGQFYFVDVPSFLRAGKIVMPGSKPVILPRTRVQDIDTPEDWQMAEAMAAGRRAGPSPQGPRTDAIMKAVMESALFCSAST